MKKAISVLSGGLDCTVATSVFAEDYEIHAITFNYGQKAFESLQQLCNNLNLSNQYALYGFVQCFKPKSFLYSQDRIGIITYQQKTHNRAN